MKSLNFHVKPFWRKKSQIEKSRFGYFTRENSNIWDFMPLKIVNFSTKTQIDYF